MTLQSNRCSRRSSENLFACQNKKGKPSLIKKLDSSSSLSLLGIDSVCSVSTSEDDCHLYKRRKMDEECDFLPTNGKVSQSKARSFRTYGDNSPPIQNGNGKSLFVVSDVEVPKSETKIVEYKEHTKASKGSIWKNSPGSHSNVDDRNISSMPYYINHKINDAGECSLPDKQITELTSSRELCIFLLLKRNIIPIKESEPHKAPTTIAHDDSESKPLFECNSCGSLEDPSHMLICDRCEGAFHLHCCYRRIKKIPNGEWYCIDCSRKKPKRQLEKFSTTKDASPKQTQRPHRGLGPIVDMLVDVEPYETKVRIGRDFQAEVPEWSGPISGSNNHFAEPSELDISETLGQWSKRCNDKKIIIGNWIKCQEVLDTGVVCGKWRRAPLFVIQSSNWDCSCAVMWDPIHADCAVPQELETGQVLQQLKYIKKLKNRLDARKEKH